MSSQDDDDYDPEMPTPRDTTKPPTVAK